LGNRLAHTLTGYIGWARGRRFLLT
jgi:hypothetical protein